jgi:hypothetical protein
MWLKTDDQAWSDPVYAQAGNEALGVLWRMLTYCAAHATDGHVPGQFALLMAEGDLGVLNRLVENELAVKDADGYYVPDYLGRHDNLTAKAAEKLRRQRSQAGRRGASKRHGKRHDKGQSNGHRPEGEVAPLATAEEEADAARLAAHNGEGGPWLRSCPARFLPSP